MSSRDRSHSFRDGSTDQGSDFGKGDRGRSRKGYPNLPPLNLSDIKASWNLPPRNQSLGYLGTTPSLHKLHPLSPSEPSSQAILSKFFSQQDDTHQRSSWSDPNRSLAPSSSSRIQSSVNPDEAHPHASSSRGTTTSSHSNTHVRHHGSSNWISQDAEGQQSFTQGYRTHEDRRSEIDGFSEASSMPSNASRDTDAQQFPQDTHADNQADGSASKSRGPSFASTNFSPIRQVNRYGEEEFRCPHCNRRCKSESSFEKHRISCTHRLGPLTLECTYCGRPYTYFGYLAKHEAECVKVHPSAFPFRPN